MSDATMLEDDRDRRERDAQLASEKGGPGQSKFPQPWGKWTAIPDETSTDALRGIADMLDCDGDKEAAIVLRGAATRLEAAEHVAQLLAGTLSTFGHYSTMHPERVLAEFAALALKETPSPDVGREAGPGSKSPVGQNG